MAQSVKKLKDLSRQEERQLVPQQTQKVHNLKQGYRCPSFTKEPKILLKPAVFRSSNGFLDLVLGRLDLNLGFSNELFVVLGCLVCVMNLEDLLTVCVIS